MSSAWLAAIGATSTAVLACGLLWFAAMRRLRGADERLLGRLDAAEARIFALEQSRVRLANLANADQADAPVTKATIRLDPPIERVFQGPALIEVPNIASQGSESQVSESSAELARRYGTIWSLADAGSSPEVISQTTGHPIGQVELILGLRRKLGQAQAAHHPEGGE
jgi:hypothetical protein